LLRGSGQAAGAALAAGTAAAAAETLGPARRMTTLGYRGRRENKTKNISNAALSVREALACVSVCV